MTIPTQSLSLLLTFASELTERLGDAINFITRNYVSTKSYLCDFFFLTYIWISPRCMKWDLIKG